MSNHTPGPWKSDDGFFVSAGLRGIASIGGTTYGQGIDKIRKENIANAHLIAAAPDLLEAAKSATQDLKGLYNSMDGRWGSLDVKAIFEALQTAIAKARGE